MQPGQGDRGKLELEVGPSAGGKRLDLFVSRNPKTDLSRHQVQRLIALGQVRVNGRQPGKPGQKVFAGDTVEVCLPPAETAGPLAQAGDIQVVFEDEELMVIDKPAGLVVHPGPGHPQHTLVNYLLHRNPELEGVGARERSGIVHRLDRDTSGLLLVAKTPGVLEALQADLKARKIRRIYRALVVGTKLPPQGEISAPVGRHPRNRKKMAVVEGGRSALTRFWVEQYFRGYALLGLELATGRTHQLRVHLSFRGHPVAGDPVYGGKGHLGLKRQALHAAELAFSHPTSGQRMRLASPLPPDFLRAYRRLLIDGGTGM